MSSNQSLKSLKFVLSILVSTNHGQHMAWPKAGTQEIFIKKTMKLLILLGKSTICALCHSQDNVMDTVEKEGTERRKLNTTWPPRGICTGMTTTQLRNTTSGLSMWLCYGTWNQRLSPQLAMRRPTTFIFNKHRWLNEPRKYHLFLIFLLK